MKLRSFECLVFMEDAKTLNLVSIETYVNEIHIHLRNEVN